MGFLNSIKNVAVNFGNKVLGITTTDETSSAQNSSVSNPISGGSVFDNSKAVASNGKAYTVQLGDTLWKIAQKHGVTVQDILKANPKITNPDLINEGEKINIPQKKEEPRNNVATAKQKAINAQQAFKNAPSRTYEEQKKELELQKDFIKAYIDWAKAVINDKSSAVHDVTDVISSIKGLKQYQNKEVATLQKELNSLLPELQAKLNPTSKTQSSKQTQQTQQTQRTQQAQRNPATKQNDKIDTQVANDLAKVASQKAAAMNTHYSCASGVRQSLEQAGLLKPGETVGKSAGEYEAFFNKNKDRFQKVSVSSRQELENLPAGYVVIWKPTGKNGDSDWKKNDGHIFVTTGDGREASDHVKKILWHDDMDFVVYAPKQQSTEQKVKSAFEARDAYLKPGTERSSANQRCYLTHYINAAEALLNDGDASARDIKTLVEKLREVPQNNKSDAVQDLVQKTQVLLKRLEQRYGL